jgi:hypothetical protein
MALPRTRKSATWMIPALTAFEQRPDRPGQP